MPLIASSGMSIRIRRASRVYTTAPPRKYADAPGTDSSAAEINPPVEDSAIAMVCLRAISLVAICSASPASSFMTSAPLQQAFQQRLLLFGRLRQRVVDHANEVG